MRTQSLLCVFCAAMVVVVSGCGRSDEITHYSIAVSEGPKDTPLPAVVDSAIPPMAAVSGQMLAAIVPQGEQTWFFKLVGPPGAVDAQKDRFEALIKSVRFASDTLLPVWELPEGWSQTGASGMRFATIVIHEADRQLEITVIPLGTMGDLNEYVLANVNRWRGQLGWPPLNRIETGDNVDGSGMTHEFNLSDGTAVTLVSLIENGNSMPTTSPGFDMANHPPLNGPLPGIGAGPPDDGFSLTYDTPAGWQAGVADGMRRAVFSVSDGNRKVEITAISLPVSGGERLANINRWRDQVKLPAITAAQLDGEIQKLALTETTADYVELTGPADAEPRESILAVLADIGPATWFFKLKGEASLAAEQRENFQAFVRSVRFGKKEGGHGE